MPRARRCRAHSLRPLLCAVFSSARLCLVSRGGQGLSSFLGASDGRPGSLLLARARVAGPWGSGEASQDLRRVLSQSTSGWRLPVRSLHQASGRARPGPAQLWASLQPPQNGRLVSTSACIHLVGPTFSLPLQFQFSGLLSFVADVASGTTALAGWEMLDLACLPGAWHRGRLPPEVLWVPS